MSLSIVPYTSIPLKLSGERDGFENMSYPKEIISLNFYIWLKCAQLVGEFEKGKKIYDINALDEKTAAFRKFFESLKRGYMMRHKEYRKQE